MMFSSSEANAALPSRSNFKKYTKYSSEFTASEPLALKSLGFALNATRAFSLAKTSNNRASVDNIFSNSARLDFLTTATEDPKPLAPNGVMIFDNELDTGAVAFVVDLLESLVVLATAADAVTEVSVETVESTVDVGVFFTGKEAALTKAS